MAIAFVILVESVVLVSVVLVVECICYWLPSDILHLCIGGTIELVLGKNSHEGVPIDNKCLKWNI